MILYLTFDKTMTSKKMNSEGWCNTLFVWQFALTQLGS